MIFYFLFLLVLLVIFINKCCKYSRDVVFGSSDVLVGGFEGISDVSVNVVDGVIEVRFCYIR